GGVGDVDVLAAGAAGAIGVDAEVLLLDLDLDVLVELRPHEDRRERRVPARRGVEGTDADEAVHADLRREVPVGVLALDEHGRALAPRLLPRLEVDDVALVAPPVAPPP